MKDMLIHRFATIIQTSAFARRLLAFVAAFALVHPFARAADVVPSEVEKAILNEDWRGVVQLLPGVETNGASATVRLIKGHACLALNQNNESLCLFLNAAAQADIEGYEAWANSLAVRRPDKPIALYLKGDALSRQAKWAAALEAFSSAVKLNSDHALTLNARGVLYAQTGDLDKAGADFKAALKTNPHFADALANCGFRLLQKRTAAKGAEDWFEQALKESPKFFLAEFGVGCARFARGEYDSADMTLHGAMSNLVCGASSLEKVMFSMDEYMVGHPEPSLANATPQELGTFIDRRLGDFVSSPNQWNYNRLISDLGTAPKAVQDQTVGRLQDLARGNSSLATQLKTFADNSQRWNGPGGVGRMAASATAANPSYKDLSVTLGSDFAKNRLDTTVRNYDMSTRISQLPGVSQASDRMGGVTTQAANPHVEDIQAYFSPGYGLLYVAEPKVAQ